MSRKLSDETKQLLEELYAEKRSVAEIARRTNVSCATVYRYVEAKQGGFTSYKEYQDDLAKKRGFTSYMEYKKDLARQRGFASLNDYLGSLAQKRGFKSRNGYSEYLVKQRGFASRSEYEEHLAKRRQQQPINQELSDLIKRELTRMGKSQGWLAEQLGVTGGAVSRYVSGRTTPRKNLHQKLLEVLELPYQCLDDLLEH